MATQITNHPAAEDVSTPWYVRLHSWVAGQLWCWGCSFAELSIDSPDLANPYWRRW